LKIGKLPRRRAVSELVGSIWAIAITLVAGAGVWAYVYTQAGASESAYSSSAGQTNTFLAEKFRVIDMNFPASNQITVWIYNTGSISLQLAQVRISDSAGLINLLYNYTKVAGVKIDYAFDLRSNLASKCKTAAVTYESPIVSTASSNLQTGQSITFTILPTSSGCPSFGQVTNSGTSYSVTVVGLYGNSVKYSQAK